MPAPFTALQLLAAYAAGIFPMADTPSADPHATAEIYWFSPDPRGIIDLDTFRPGRTLRNLRRHHPFVVRANRDFRAVMDACADRPEGTWLSDDLKDVYGELHDIGHAQSVECYLPWMPAGRERRTMSATMRHRLGDEALADPDRATVLAGGLYGVTLGGAFFGESMFHRCTGASNVALMVLVDHLRARGYRLLDTQWLTDHLQRFAGSYISRGAYLARLEDALAEEPAFLADPSQTILELPRQSPLPSPPQRS